jgi:hypothetical protein
MYPNQNWVEASPLEIIPGGCEIISPVTIKTVIEIALAQ